MDDPFERLKETYALERLERDDIVEVCSVCGNDIRTMIFKGTGFCGIECEKKKVEARILLELAAQLDKHE